MADISSLVPSCLDEFRSLNDSLAVLTPKCGPGGDDVPEDVRPSIKNQLGRFRVWSMNLGAHRTGRSSLDYRLQDASHIRTQVINLLNGLVECLQDGISIVSGTVEPWDSMEPTSDDEDSDNDGLEANCLADLTELSQIVSEASEIINCLFRLSVSIHHPAPHDRFRRSAMIDTSHYEAFDSAHIQNKFPSAHQGIVNQLGKANSFRRQYFRYREEHHRKLAQGLPDGGMEPPCDDTKTIGDTTAASSLPQHLKTSNSGGSRVEDFDTRSEAGRTETSFAPSSVPDGSRSRMPSMPDEAQQGPFECPFCYRMISVETTKDWRKHILGDLRPYICLYPDCPAAGQDFQRRHQWMQHFQQAHWNVFVCPFGCEDVQVDDLPTLKAHLATFHKEHAQSLSPESLIQLSEQERPLDAPKQCELCGEDLDSFKAYTRHVGRHQEDVALFVLPDRGLDEESLSDDQNEESEHHAIKMSDGLPPFLFNDTAVHEDKDKVPPPSPYKLLETQLAQIAHQQRVRAAQQQRFQAAHQAPRVEALRWDSCEAVPPPPQPSQGPPSAHLKSPPFAPEPESSEFDPIAQLTKLRGPDISFEDEPDHNAPGTLASSHQTHGPHHDDASQDGSGPKDGSGASLTATQSPNREDMQSGPRHSGIIEGPGFVFYPAPDVSFKDSEGRIKLAPFWSTVQESTGLREESSVDNPEYNPDEHLRPEINHKPPPANAQDEPGGAAHREQSQKKSPRRSRGVDLDFNTGGESQFGLRECPTKATEGCPYKTPNQRDLRRHLWTSHLVYARENNIPEWKMKCDFPGCEYKGRNDDLWRHKEAVGHHRKPGQP